MGTEARVFELIPRVLRTGTLARVAIARASGQLFPAGARCRVTVTPTEGWPGGTRQDQSRVLEAVERDGRLEVPLELAAEQEYVLQVFEDPEAKPWTLPELRLYAVEHDLFDRLPWKADLHLHSKRSDGADEPRAVPAACRRIGLDLMALTDHRLYAPSLEAIRAFDGCPVDLTMLPGEEVHPPDTETHIVHVGGHSSVNALFESDGYRRGVEELANALPGGDRALAACLWSFERIREAGGIGILAHPSWYTHRSYNIPAALLEELYERRPFEALELVGGYYPYQAESNVLQVARWQEELARGRNMAVVGASDAHSLTKGELFGWYWTVFFAAEPSLDGLRDALAGRWSVAVEARPGEAVRAFGSFRLVRFAHFLIREVFPAHDELCALEGGLMEGHLAGDRSAAGALGARRGAVRALYRRLWQG